MSDAESPQDTSSDEWLADQHRRMVTHLAAILDVEAGLRETTLPARNADLVAELGGVLDVEAGLSAITSKTSIVTSHDSQELVGTSESRGPTTRIALLIGCADYEDSAFQQLSAPTQDVESLKRVLIQPAIGDFTVDKLLDQSSSVVRERIERFFANRKADDLLLLYFSCHGVLDRRGRLHFVASDTKNELLGSTGIAARWIRRQMNRSRSRRIVLLLDCCYGGAFAGDLEQGRGTRAGKILKQLDGRGHVVITASGKAEVARGSAFTNAVVRGLATGAADLDGDGEISACELYRYVCERVRQNTPDQTPTMSANGPPNQVDLAKNSQEPSSLPDELETALTNENAWRRLWAVDGLRRILDGDCPGGQKRAARRVLRRLRDHGADSDTRLAAQESLRRVAEFVDGSVSRSRRVGWLARICLVLALVVLGGVLHIAVEQISGSLARQAPPDHPIACSPSVKPADGVLSFGTLLPKSGQFSYSGPALDAGARLAMKDITDAGSIPGIAVTFDEANQRDEGGPSTDTGRQSADALLAGGVDVIIGPSTSPTALKVIDKITCAGVIMFAPANTSPAFTTYPDHGLYFRTAPSSLLESAVLGKLVVDDANSTVVVISRDDAFGNPLRESTAREIQKSGGRVLDSFSYDPNASNYDKEVARIKAENPSAIVLIGFTEDAQILAKMIKEGIGPTSKHVYLAGANTTNTLISQVSPRAPGVLAGLKGTPLDTGGEAFVTRLKELNPGLRDLVYAAQAYDAVVITALAAAIAGTDAPAAIAKEINGVTRDGERCLSFAECMKLVKAGKNIAYQGPSGSLDFTDSGEPSSATYVISEIQADGTVKPLRSVKVTA